MAFAPTPTDYPEVPNKEALWNVTQLLKLSAYINHAHPSPPPPPTPAECEAVAAYLIEVAEWMVKHHRTATTKSRGRARRSLGKRNGSSRSTTRRRRVT